MQSNHAKSLSYKSVPLTVVLGHLLLGIVLLFASFLMSVPATLQTGMMVFVGYVLANRFRVYLIDGRWVEIALELFPLSMIWLWFCVGGTVALTDIYYTWNIPLRSRFVYYTDTTMLVTNIYVIIGMFCYSTLFRATYQRARDGVAEGQKVYVPSILAKNLIIWPLVLFDLGTRFYLILNGSYFTRVTNPEIELRTATYFHLYSTTQYLTIALLVYLSSRSKAKGIYFLLLLVVGATIFMRGSRVDIVFAFFTAALTYLLLYDIKRPVKAMFLFAVFAAFFAAVIAPAIQISREEVRISYSGNVENIDGPAAAFDYFFRYLPETGWAILTNREQTSHRINQGMDLYIGQYAAVMASVNQRLINGDVALNTDAFMESLLLTIPRAIYPGKPNYAAGLELQLHYDFNTLISATEGTDIHGSPITDVFSMLHLPGILLFISVCALGMGFVAGKLQQWLSLLGVIIVIGLAPNMRFFGDSFGHHLALVRNALFVLIYVYIVLSLTRTGADQDK